MPGSAHLPGEIVLSWTRDCTLCAAAVEQQHVGMVSSKVKVILRTRPTPNFSSSGIAIRDDRKVHSLCQTPASGCQVLTIKVFAPIHTAARACTPAAGCVPCSHCCSWTTDPLFFRASLSMLQRGVARPHQTTRLSSRRSCTMHRRRPLLRCASRFLINVNAASN